MPLDIQNRRQKPRLQTQQIEDIVKTICLAIAPRIQRRWPDISIVLTGDDTIHELNRDWRGKDKPTDVLSFSQLEGLPGVQLPVADPAPYQAWGDVVISYDTAMRQATQRGHDLETEIKILLVHGILHLLGHDHVHGGWQARRMRQEEERLLTQLRKSKRTS